VVTVAAHKEKPGVTNVVIDHTAAARLAIKHLYEIGHRKIAFIKGHRHRLPLGGDDADCAGVWRATHAGTHGTDAEWQLVA
jgi:DNA-binding LacI/PurR family transcriptional regulator